MIQTPTTLNVADNTGVKKLKCIKVLGGSRRRYATLGDIIVCSVVDIIPTCSIEKGKVVKAVIVRVKKEVRRNDGSYIRFDENAAVIVDDKKAVSYTHLTLPMNREV